MKNAFLATFFLLLFPFWITCKKEDDPNAPFVTFLAPTEYQKFNVGEFITVKFKISDKTKIEFAQLSISDENQLQVLPALVFTDLGKGQILEQTIAINNIFITSGVYYVRIKTSDGVNEETFFKKIIIYELPLRKKAIYYIGKAAGQHKVFKVDSLNLTSLAYPLFGDFIGSSIDSRNQQLTTLGGYTGKLLCSNLYDLSEAWKEANVSTTYPKFRAISFGNGLHFVSFSDGFIKGYTNLGAVNYIASADQNVYYPIKTGISSKYILNEQASFVGNLKKLVLYYFPFGGAKQEINFVGDVVEILPKNETDFFVFYNQGNAGQISIYSSLANGLSYTFNSPSMGRIKSVTAVIDNEIFVVGTENGIYKFSYNPQNFVLFKGGILATKLKYDSVNNQLIASENKNINFYDYNSGNFLKSITSSDTIVDFQLLYNR